MITNNENEILNLSATKKDYYQIWNELLETAAKLSKRYDMSAAWNPENTNESDPGIVLLKVLTAVADKINYNIDKNILEAYMPTAAQIESVRRICDLLGHDMKYYRSATTAVNIKINNKASKVAYRINIPMFTPLTDENNTVTYTTVEEKPLEINEGILFSDTLNCIQGTVVECESTTNNVINLTHLDDNNRYYLPETSVAENGIFIYNYNSENSDAVEFWTKSSNLNEELLKSKVYKFGFDSNKKMPYIQFPDDIANIIQDGLKIYYTRTAGASGNISAGTISKFKNDSILSKECYSSDDGGNSWEICEAGIGTEYCTITNASSATNGSNIETIKQTYNSFKKTIGTFNTLVSCRDYMNKIYSLTISDTDTTPLVSNVVVSDIRDDINRSVNICTFNTVGPSYVTEAVDDKITPFDLVLYTLTSIPNTTTTKYNYDKSFMFSESNFESIKDGLKKSKTMAHVFKTPDDDDIVCIKNYLTLTGKITTVHKISSYEEESIIQAVKSNIYKTFNSRNIDFGEEIPYNDILECIESASSLIKNVYLDEPELETKFLLKNGLELDLGKTETSDQWKEAYNKIALKNILAGKIELFEYDTTFKPRLDAEKYDTYESVYPADSNKVIKSIETSCELPIKDIPSDGIELKENEVIQFRFPSYRTTLIYPCYVNYYFKSTESKTILANTIYQLQNGEYLYINYTPTSSDASVTLSPKNEEYKPGDIFRPSLAIDSNPSSGSKKDKTWKSSWNINCMQTLGTNDQIEIMEKVEINYPDIKSGQSMPSGSETVNIFWAINDVNKSLTSDGRYEKFPFVWETVSEGDIEKYIGKYILKDGEYLFCADPDKTAYVEYGSGTEISYHCENKTDITKPIIDNANVDFDQLITEDIWEKITFTCNNYLKVSEYQFKNYSEGDVLTKINLNSQTIQSLSNDWLDCKAISGVIAEVSGETVADNNISGVCWQVRSALLMNVGSNLVQTLHNSYDHIKLYYNDGNLTDLYPTEANGELSIQTSNRIQNDGGKFDACITEIQESENGNKLIKKYNTKVQPFKLNQLSVQRDGSNIAIKSLQNGNSWHCANELKNSDVIKLQTSIPKNEFGLIMLYYSGGSSIEESTAGETTSTDYNGVIISLKDSSNKSVEPKIYNLDSEWWPKLKRDSIYILQNGINIVKIPNNVTKIELKAVYSSDTHTGKLIFSDLDLIIGINKAIDYQGKEDDLLEEINKLDKKHQFYYNGILDNSNIIDINTAIGEKLSDPKIWYDYNNVANKFVISEINSDELSSGIMIASTSKLKY